MKRKELRIVQGHKYKLDLETHAWLENRLRGIGTRLRRQEVPHEFRREAGLSLTNFMNMFDLNVPLIYSRF